MNNNWRNTIVTQAKLIIYPSEIVLASITVGSVMGLVSSSRQWLLLAFLLIFVIATIILWVSTPTRKKSKVSDEGIFDYYGG
jgi:membrane-associated HD superfamily phosphohydrolase